MSVQHGLQQYVGRRVDVHWAYGVGSAAPVAHDCWEGGYVMIGFRRQSEAHYESMGARYRSTALCRVRDVHTGEERWVERVRHAELHDDESECVASYGGLAAARHRQTGEVRWLDRYMLRELSAHWEPAHDAPQPPSATRYRRTAETQ